MIKLVAVIIIRTCTDLSFKMAVRRLQFTSFSSVGKNLCAMLLNPFCWLGGFLGVANVVMWCSSLEDFDLSYAYPFLSISYITIILSGRFLFNESLDQQKLIGLCFIGLGAIALFLG